MTQGNYTSIIDLYQEEIRKQVRQSLLNHGEASVLIENDKHQLSYFNNELTIFIGEDEIEDNNTLVSIQIDIDNIIEQEAIEVETYFR